METNRRREREREEEGEGEGERERCKWLSSGCFRVVSDWFQTLLGALTGLCSFPRKEAELNAPAMKPKQKNQHIIPAIKKRNKAMML